MGGGREERPDHVGEGMGHVLQLPGVDLHPVPLPVELEPAPVVLELGGHLPVIGHHLPDGPLLGQHQPDGPEDLDLHGTEGLRSLPGQHRRLSQVVVGLEGVLHVPGRDAEGLRDGVPDVPLADADPQLTHHQACQVPALTGLRVGQEHPDRARLPPLGPLPLLPGNLPELAVHVGQGEGLGKEGGLCLPCQELLRRLSRVARPVHRLHHRLLPDPGHGGDGLVEEVGPDAQLQRRPVREDPAHDEPDKEGELRVIQRGEDAGNDIDHLQPSADPLQPVADQGEVFELHGSHDTSARCPPPRGTGALLCGCGREDK